MAETVQQDDSSDFNLVPAGNWQPDVPAPTNEGLISGLNLVPRATGLYGPERQPTTAFSQSVTPFGSALKAHGQFHSSSLLQGQTTRFYVGTFATGSGDSHIVAQPEDDAWVDLSRAGGYTITAFQPWAFANFGLLALAANRVTPIQVSDGIGGIFADVPDSPRCSDIAEVAGFLVGIRPDDTVFGEGTQDFRVTWSAIGDAENWPDPTSTEAINVQSGFRDLLGGGPLRRVIPGIGGADAVIISGRKIWRMNFVGPPAIWRFDQVENDQGCEIPGMVATFNETAFFLGHNGFYWFDGQNATPIGQGEMDDFFINDVTFSSTFGFQNQAVSAVDSVNKNYVVGYRNSAALDDHNNRILRFNWLTRQWSNSAQSADVMGSLSNRASLIDSPTLHVMGANFQTAKFEGATLEATIETREIFHQGGQRTRIKSVLPLVDTDSVDVKMRTRERISQTPVESVERTFCNHGNVRFDPTVVEGRFYRAFLTIAAAAEWTAYQGLQYEVTPWSYGPKVPPP
ncbi:MAG: hypothetical protein ACR2QH_15325 [Geminicoccaceae bacterium]